MSDSQPSSQASDSTAAESSQAQSPARTATLNHGNSFNDSAHAESAKTTWAEGSDTQAIPNQRPTEPRAFAIGVAEDMGSRRTMEDSFSFVVDYAGVCDQGYFAVFDGHAGKHAAEWCGKHFHEHLAQNLSTNPNSAVPEVYAKTFHAVDRVLQQLTDSGATHSGCTAVTAFLRLEDSEGRQSFAPNVQGVIDSAVATYFAPVSGSSSPARSSTPTTEVKRAKIKSLFGGGNSNSSGIKKGSNDAESFAIDGATKAVKAAKAIDASGWARRVLYTANVGDARAVLSRGGRAIRLSYDHKGSDKAEVKRITDAGGFVLNNRVNGVLAVTRSLGDTAMKEFVVGSPYTSEMELTPEDDFLIMACDGLWDVVEDQKAVDLVHHCSDAQQAADILLKHALDNFSHDNVTVLVVKLSLESNKMDIS